MKLVMLVAEVNEPVTLTLEAASQLVVPEPMSSADDVDLWL